MEKIKKFFINLMESGVTGERCEFPDGFTEEDFSVLFSISKKHESAALIGYALSDCGVDIGRTKRDFFEEQTKCLFIYETQKHDLIELSELFGKNKVPFMPIKGAVIKELYSAPETRYSCDVDVLIKKTDYLRAVAVMKSAGYKLPKSIKKEKDISAVAAGGTVFDLHSVFSVEKGNMLTEIIWETAVPDKDNPYLFHASPEAIACYTADHAARHFKEGGCGIKTVADFIAINKKLSIDKNLLNSLLEKTGNKKFYDGITRLIKAWREESQDEFTDAFGSFILDGGVFGTFEQSAAMASVGEKHFILKKIFVPKAELEKTFPDLKKHPFFLPFYEVKRWCFFLSKDRRKIAGAKIKASHNNELVKKAEYLKKELGI